jgi:hypothetical protein
VAGDQAERLAENESVFRDINEAISNGQWPGEPQSQVGFLCECAQLGCNDVIELTPREYEHVRSDGKHFLVAIGHQTPSVEVVLESHAGYLIVEKRSRAGERAEEIDPRG